MARGNELYWSISPIEAESGLCTKMNKFGVRFLVTRSVRTDPERANFTERRFEPKCRTMLVNEKSFIHKNSLAIDSAFVAYCLTK